MAKPNEYRETYVLNTDVNYNNADKSSGGTFSSEGILHAGRVVWLSKPSQTPDEPVSAYAEGVGVVTLSANCLQRAS